MKKQDMVNKIAEQSGESKSSVERVIDALGEVATEALRSGDSVTLPHLGKMSPNRRAARVGRNPSTGEEISIPARTVAKFKAGSALTEALN